MPLSLSTANQRRNNPQFLDSIHHNNLLNNILAKIEANIAGADDAIVLDSEGFVSETNATNIFMVSRGTYTPHLQTRPARYNAEARLEPRGLRRHPVGGEEAQYV